MDGSVPNKLSRGGRAVAVGGGERLSRDAINALPLFHYAGRISLAKTREEVEEAIARLSGEKVLGFDTETPPSFRKGQAHPPALVQLAGEREVALFPFRWQPLGEALVALLENPAVIKTGVAVHDDMRFLAGIFPFTPRGVVDLGDVAAHNGLKNRGLRGLAATFLGLRISKGEQCSNWGARELSPRQVTYAATDAWASRRIYLAMLEAELDMDVSAPLSLRKSKTRQMRPRRRPRQYPRNP